MTRPAILERPDDVRPQPALRVQRMGRRGFRTGYMADGLVEPVAFLDAVREYAKRERRDGGAYELAGGLAYVRYVFLRRINGSNMREVPAGAIRAFPATILDLQLARRDADALGMERSNEEIIERHRRLCADCTETALCGWPDRAIGTGPDAWWRRKARDARRRIAFDQLSARLLPAVAIEMRRRIRFRAQTLLAARGAVPDPELLASGEGTITLLRQTGEIAVAVAQEPRRHHLGVLAVHYENGRLVLRGEDATDLNREATDEDYYYDTVVAAGLERLSDEDLIGCAHLHPCSLSDAPAASREWGRFLDPAAETASRAA